MPETSTTQAKSEYWQRPERMYHKGITRTQSKLWRAMDALAKELLLQHEPYTDGPEALKIKDKMRRDDEMRALEAGENLQKKKKGGR